MDRVSLSAAFIGLVAALALWVVFSLQFPFNVGGFGIVSARDGVIVVNDGDIASYNAANHEFMLTADGAERIMKAEMYLEGPFTIIVGGEEVFNGLFVPPIISRSYPSNQIVITYPSFDSNYNVMKMQMGYPWDEPVSPDPRDDPRIARYFDATGRLLR
jgi:hypothetical protein